MSVLASDWKSKVISSKELAEAFSYWATAAGIIVAVCAGIFALIHTILERRQQKWFRARELYDRYHEKCIDFPEYFCDYWLRSDIDRVDRERYISFMHFMLTAIEDIVLLDGRPEWRTSLIFDLKPHTAYLKSEDFCSVADCYFEEVRGLVREAIYLDQGQAVHA